MISESSRHLYIHFPYCLYKCHYCDFNSHAYDKSKIPQAGYTESLLNEMNLRRGCFEKNGRSYFSPGTAIDTIFFGGGTPSLMNPHDVAKILSEVSQYFTLRNDAEITLEANPGTLSRQLLQDFVMAGINRISVGVQSLNDAYLKNYGRIHTADQAREVLTWLSQGVVPRASVDLIYGFPGQTVSDWQKELREIQGHGLDHLSCYALTVEEGTILAKEVRDRRILAPDADTQAEMQILTDASLKESGLQAYEISNFARPGFECQHNLGYWRYQSYVGLGAGAVSHFSENRIYRETNVRSPEHYRESVRLEKDWFTTEMIDRKTAIKEFFMMGLRIHQGIAKTDFEKLFGISIEEILGETLPEMVAKGWLKNTMESLAPTPLGCLYHSQIMLKVFQIVEGCIKMSSPS